MNLPAFPRTRFALLTLGRLALRDDAGREEDALRKRRRKLAVLAVLAVEGRPLSRDFLVEMFWGDQPEERARHSLSDALSHLRRVLGPEALELGRTEVALTDRVDLAVDANEFAAAAAAGDHARAVATYGGPFLDGVYVPGSYTFEHWLDRHRCRLQRLFEEACAGSCSELIRSQRWDQCGDIARRWLDVAPLSGEAARYHLEALARPGTHDSARRALQSYERLRGRLRHEYELDPDPVVVALADELRVRATSGDPEPPSLPPEGQAPTAPRPPSAPGRRVRRHLEVAAIVLLGVIGAAVLPWRSDGTPPMAREVIAVLPFTVHGDDELTYLRDGMVDLLSTNLDGAGTLRAVDPRAVLGASADQRLTPEQGRAIAARLGAGLYVLGDVVEAGGRLRITAALYGEEAEHNALARVTVEGTAAELFGVVDRLTARLLAAHSDTPPEQLARLAGLTTGSLPALKAYLKGEQHYRSGRYPLAYDAFQRAAMVDTAFALAYYRLSLAGNWAGIGTWDSIIAYSGRAVRHAGRLTPHGRLLVQALHAWHVGRDDEAERVYRDVIAMHPQDVEAWYQLGEIRFHSNPRRGRSFVEAREPFARVLAAEPGHLPALLHLLRISAYEARSDELDSLTRRALALTPDGEAELWLHAFHAFAVGDPEARGAALERLRAGADEMARISADRVAVFTRDLEGAARIAELLVEPTRPADLRAYGHVWLAYLDVARGRIRAARAHLTAAERLDLAIGLPARAMVEVLPFVPISRETLERTLRDLERWDAASVPPTATPYLVATNGLHAEIRSYLIGLLATRLGDETTTAGAVVALDTGGRTPEGRAFARGLAASVRANAAVARGQPAEALALLEASRLVVSEGLLEMPVGAQGYERFARAQSLRALGREREALAWLSSLGETSIPELVYLAPAHLALGQIHERAGDTAAAAREYQLFGDLWREADEELQPIVSEARRRLSRLGSPPAS